MKKIILFLFWGLTTSLQAQSPTYHWTRVIGSNHIDTPKDMAQDANGNTYVVGEFGGTADFDPSSGVTNIHGFGYSDIFLAKYDSNGDYLWATRIGGGSEDEARKLAIDNNGNVYVTGRFAYECRFDSDTTNTVYSISSWGIFIAKYDNNGNYIWAKVFNSDSGDIDINGIALDANNNPYVVGSFSSTVDFDASANTANLSTSSDTDYDIFIAKYNSNGTYGWAKKIGGSSNDYGQALALHGNEIVITGKYYSPSVDFDPSANSAIITATQTQNIYIAKYNLSGGYVWAQALISPYAKDSKAIATDSNGDIVIVGVGVDTVDFDPSVGVANLILPNDGDYFMAKYASNGSYIWVKALEGTGGGAFEKANAIEIDANNNIYIGGQFNDSLDLDPSAGVHLVVSNSLFNAFWAKYDSNGSFLWGDMLQSYNNVICYDIHANAAGEVFILGNFTGIVNFAPNSINQFTAQAYQDIFLSKYGATNNCSIQSISVDNISPCNGNSYTVTLTVNHSNAPTTGFLVVQGQNFLLNTSPQTVVFNNLVADSALVQLYAYYSADTACTYTMADAWRAPAPCLNTSISRENSAPMRIYPNPAQTYIYIEVEEESEARLFNALGQPLGNYLLMMGNNSIDLSNLPAGMYLLQTAQGQHKWSSKTH